MNSHIHMLGGATIAISAILALGPTPLAAQAAPPEPAMGTAATAPPPAATESPIIGPVEGSVAPAAPMIVAEPLPAEPVPLADPPATNEIDAAASPAAASEPVTQATSRERAAAAPAPRANPAQTDAPVIMDEAAPAEETLEADELAPLAIDPIPLALPVEPETALQPADQSEEAILAGLLAALGFGAIGWTALALRRRRRRAAQLRPLPMVGKSLSVESGQESIPVAAVPIAPPTPNDIRAWMEPNAAAERDNAEVPNGRAAVALPMKEPATFAERDALLRRMVQAPPDRANPFRAAKARIRRARLIIQSLGHRFENGRSWIDFSQYPGNWPELRPNYAAAA